MSRARALIARTGVAGPRSAAVGVRAALTVASVLAVGCGVRTPSPLAIDALVRARGPLEARRDLEIRVVEDPKDVQARLALAALAEAQHRPSEALAQLEVVVALGGPLGTRWHDDDRARLARLVLARGRARLARGAPTALADLERVGGATAIELDGARAALAIAELAHADAEVRARGRVRLAGVHAIPEPARRGAMPGASAEERGALGVYLWEHGAKRAAYEALDEWRRRSSPSPSPSPTPSDVAMTYALARAWWQPTDRRGARGELRARDVVGDPAREAAFVASPAARTADPIDAAAIVAIAIRASVANGSALGATIAARVELAALAGADVTRPFPDVAPPARAVLARLVGRPQGAAVPAVATLATDDDRLVAGVAAALAGATHAEIETYVRDPDVLAWLAGTTPRTTTATYADAIAAAVARAVGPLADPTRAAVVAIAEADRRDPAIAERLGRDLVAASDDAARGSAIVGAAFGALGDPARARLAWQAAVDASAEPTFQRGLALAIARAGDADAALLAATTAAAASGDPAVVWLAVARALAAAGRPVHALEAARAALDLGDAALAIDALDVAIGQSRALGRDAQAAALAARRARLAPAPTPNDDDPTDAVAALAAYRRFQTASTIARLWVASRWTLADAPVRAALLVALAPDDPRRAIVRAELGVLAGAADPETSAVALAALR